MSISIDFVIIFSKHHSVDYDYITSFAGGAVAALASKYNKANINFNRSYISAIVCFLFLLISLFETASNMYCKLILISIFTFTALGNNLFGLLKLSFLKFLGEICYSTYLLHGVVLFTWFYFVIRFKDARNMSESHYMLNILVTTPIVIVLSYVSFRLFEKPFMNISHRLRVK